MSSPLASPEPKDAPIPVIGEIGSFWTPGSSVTTHTGAPIPSDLAFVAPPPTDEIGEVLTAYSTVRKGTGGDPKYLARFGWGLMCALLGLIVGFGIGSFIQLVLPAIILSVVGVLGGFALGWIFSAPENSTTYVGTTGAVKYVWKGKDKPMLTGNILRYNEVSSATFGSVSHYSNGIYTGTEYAFYYNGYETGKGKPPVLMTVKGRYYRSSGPADDNEAFHLGTAIDTAYSQYRFPKCVAILDQGGAVPFTVISQGILSVSAEGLRVKLRGKEEFVPKDSIAGVNVNQGMVTITRAGFKKGVLGIGSDGVYSFAYNQLSSARLFMALLAYVIRDDNDSASNASSGS